MKIPIVNCKKCKGSGYVNELYGQRRAMACLVCFGGRMPPTKIICNKCKGTGKTELTPTLFGAWVNSCITCHGSGTLGIR